VRTDAGCVQRFFLTPGLATTIPHKQLILFGFRAGFKPATIRLSVARLATSPVPKGSPTVAKTIGITDVACFAAMIAAVNARDDDIE
jgi:hypothetical protein